MNLRTVTHKLQENSWLILILFIGMLLRLYGLSHGTSFHPDERHIVMTAEKLSWADLNPHFFAYGSFPFYLLWATSGILGIFSEYLAQYDGLFLVGRLISVSFAVGAGLLTYKLAQICFKSRAIALLSAAFLMFNSFHIQLSHFYAFDGVLTTLNIAVLIATTMILESGGKNRWVFLCGALLGLSIATKISALSLFIPIGLTLLLLILDSKGKISILFVKFLALALTALIVFTIAEPYAWLDWTTFIANNKEQITMVRGDWRPPYTVQYENTAPYLYHLEQIFKYTIGMPIALLGVLGICAAAALQFKRINRNHLLLLSWILPTFLVIGGYQVKFPRYLIPIYPVFFIFAAYACMQACSFITRYFPARKYFQLIIMLLTVGYCLIRSLALVSIYQEPHTYHTASRWIYANIPAGARFLEGHWDDTLPLTLPGLEASRYKFEGRQYELPLYEPDTTDKLNLVAERTAASDYIIFPTQRLSGSLMRVPEEFEQSNNYLKLLYSGNLGYEFVKTFKVRPKFGPFIYNDDLADESLSVYDHPKAAIFKNVERLSTEEIIKRVLSPEQFQPLPNRSEVMLKDVGINSEDSETPSSLTALFLWIITIEVLALAAFPLISWLLPLFPDSAYGLSKVFGFFIFGFISWYIPAQGLASADRQFCLSLFFIIIAASIYFGKGTECIRSFYKTARVHLITAEIIFLASFLTFAVMRCITPEIFWGEKPMDSTLLHFFARNTNLPPEDPWSAGTSMRYYYLGSYFFASLLKLTNIPPEIGYNLAIATLPAFCLASCYSILNLLTRSLRFSILGSLIVVLGSNFEILNLKFIQGKKLNFDTFWAATRLFTPPGFTEYPLWSFIFADLHAHVTAIAICILVLGLGLGLMTTSATTSVFRFWMQRVFYGLVWGSLMAFNTWDFIVYAPVTFLFIFLRPMGGSNNSLMRKLLTKIKTIFAEVMVVGISAFVAIAPYMFATKPEAGASWGWNHAFEFNTLGQIMRHFGIWICAFIAASLLIIFKYWRNFLKLDPIASSAALLLAAAPIFLGIACDFHGSRPAPWGILVLCSAMVALALVVLLLPSRFSLTIRFSSSCIVIAALILSFCEVFFLIDRMNSVFKFYSSIWVLFATATVSITAYSKMLFKGGTASKFSLVGTIIFYSIFIPILLTCITGTAINCWIMATFHRVEEGPRPTLNGSLYLAATNPNEYSLIRWINSNIKGQARIIEAHGDSYREFTRIAMHTGLSTVLGWEHHVKQRGTPEREVYRRKADINEIYSTSNAELANNIMNRYKVDLIVIGKVERDNYPSTGLKKFDDNPGLFPVLFRSADTVLYARTDALKAGLASGAVQFNPNSGS